MKSATNDLLSRQVLSTKAIRQIDQIAVSQYGMNSLVLMENAALGCVEWMEAHVSEKDRSPGDITILCGRGNNGGDGLAIARHLRVRGWNCHVWVAADPQKLSPDAQHNYNVLTCQDEHFATIPPADLVTVEQRLATSTVILDCLLGTGATGAPRAPFDRLIQSANASSANRIAIDVPTGVDSETGDVAGVAFAADTTLSFVARKPAMAMEEVRHRFGKVVILPIGIPAALIKRVLAETNG
ncbi:MAG TPA: NAD(P)H-hydrate epimerase [Planctomycetaceae bacterium]|nr:NAD(P)H-hydrate epimerase [Planctomycetaceae bacterium]